MSFSHELPLRDAQAVTGSVYEPSRLRVARHEAHARAFGLTLPPPIYEAGTITYACADDRLRHHRLDWEAQPRTLDAVDTIRTRIVNERRADITVRTAGLSMLPDGRLQVAGMDPLHVEPRGFEALCRHLGPGFSGAGAYLLSLEPATRATVFNHQLARAKAEDAHLRLYFTDRLCLRTRAPGRRRSVYAVVATSYRPYDADKFLTDASAAMLAQSTSTLEDARGSAHYDPVSTRVDVNMIWSANAIQNLAAGDVFKGGMRIRTGDAANGGLRVDLVLWRNRCLNMLVIGRASHKLFSRQHRGQYDDISGLMHDAVARSHMFIEGFAEDWHLLRKTPATQIRVHGERNLDVAEILARLARSGVLDGLRGDAVERGLREAWDKEPGETAADIVNAVTRYAHESGIAREHTDAIEQIAGDFVASLTSRSCTLVA